MRRSSSGRAASPLRARFAPSGPLRGEVRAPADKSISHRAALVAAMCSQPVAIHGYLDAHDTRSTLAAITAIGASVREDRGQLIVDGVGLRGPRPVDAAIDVGNAGTLLRLLPGWLAGQAGRSWTLDGDASIRRRPVDRIAEPLRRMGARIEARAGRLPPLTVHGATLRAIDYELPVASAQVKSCVLLAGLTAAGATIVREPTLSRDHTERLLARAGATLAALPDGVRILAADVLGLDEIRVPGDPSSAAFMLAAAVLVPGSHVVVRDVGVNRTRTGFLRILARMGVEVGGSLEPALVEPQSDTDWASSVAAGAASRPDRAIPSVEPLSDLEAVAGQLHGTVVEAAEVPAAIDELPLVALLGCFADGETVVRGAQELRVKESNRISGVVEGLRGLGARIEETDDGFAVRGGERLRGGTLDARGDHRMAMLGAIAGLASREGVEVIGMEAAAVSYPGFAADLEALTASSA